MQHYRVLLLPELLIVTYNFYNESMNDTSLVTHLFVYSLNQMIPPLTNLFIVIDTQRID